MKKRKNQGLWRWPTIARKNLAIFGAGEFARLAALYFSEDSPYRVKFLIVDDEFLPASGTALDLPVIPRSRVGSYLSPQSHHVFVAISATRLSEVRMKRIRFFQSLGFHLATFVSSRAYVESDVSVGKNVFIFESNTLQSRTSIKDGAVLWSGNHIGHESTVGNFSFLSSHVCIGGRATVGSRCYLGMNATIRDTVSLGDFTVVGANSFVNRDFSGRGVLVGTPAKLLEGRDPLNAVT